MARASTSLDPSATKRSMRVRSPPGSSGASSRTSLVLSAMSACTTSLESDTSAATSSGVGSRTSFWRSTSVARMIRERSAVRLRGTRTVRPCLAMAARMACRIHQTA